MVDSLDDLGISPMAVIRSPVIPISAFPGAAPVPSTTVPPRIITSNAKFFSPVSSTVDLPNGGRLRRHQNEATMPKLCHRASAPILVTH